MKVNEIFRSIEGEGIRAGVLATFIRLYGCNLNCSYCDTRYSCVGDSYREMTVEEIVRNVDRIAIGRAVTITGGEPLIHEDIEDLINALIQQNYEVNIETNGTTIPPIPSQPKALFYTMDYKCPSSGQTSMMNTAAINALTSLDVLKFVVGSDTDLSRVWAVIKTFNLKCFIFLSPVFGSIEPREIVAYMQANRMDYARIQLQLHKIIWDPQKRGV